MNKQPAIPDGNDDFERFFEIQDQSLPELSGETIDDSQSQRVNSYWQKLTESRSRMQLTDNQLSDAMMMKEARFGSKKARNRLIKRMTPDITTLARRYSSFHVNCEIEDLFQLGSLEVLKALLHFGSNKFGEFRRYARVAIRRAMGKHVQRRAFGLTIPARTAIDLRAYRKAKEALTQSLCRQPNVKEISVKSGLKENLVVVLMKIESRLDVYSLDQLLSNEPDDENSQRPVLRASEDMEPEYQYRKSEIERLVNRMRRVSSPREESVLVGLFGLDGSEEKSLEEMSLELKMTKQGVARLRDRLLSRLKQQFANHSFQLHR